MRSDQVCQERLKEIWEWRGWGWGGAGAGGYVYVFLERRRNEMKKTHCRYTVKKTLGSFPAH